jgi:5-amino-6-(5-phospho-D-ribitylamino)uracil phosphatase
MDIKLIALDMDGTLLNTKEEIPEENRAAIRKAEEKGVKVVLSTGRNLMTCRDYAASLELSSYLVTVNGSEIYGPTGELVERNLINKELMNWMWDISKKHQTGFWALSSDKIWRDEMPDDLTTYEWLKFGFNIEDDELREAVMKQLRERGELEISNSSPINIEVNALGINKARALHNVCKLLGITMDHVMAVGDSLNDIAMIREAGLGIAMGNAQEVVKEAADWVTGKNTDNGVAQAIQKWVLD